MLILSVHAVVVLKVSTHAELLAVSLCMGGPISNAVVFLLCTAWCLFREVWKGYLDTEEGTGRILERPPIPIVYLPRNPR